MVLHLHRESGRLQVDRSGKAGSGLFCKHSSPPSPLSAPQMPRRRSSGSGSVFTTAIFSLACLRDFLGAEEVEGEVQVVHRAFRGRRVKEVEPILLLTLFLFFPLGSSSSPLDPVPPALGTSRGSSSSFPSCPSLERAPQPWTRSRPPTTASPPPPLSTLAFAASDII